MDLKQRQGVLGLETARQVMTTYLILAVTAVAVILSLVSIQDGVGNTIDNVVRTPVVVVSNETNAFINITGYTLSGYNSSWSSISVTDLWNKTTNVQILSGNYTISSTGVLTNASTSAFSTNNYLTNVSYNYVYTYTEDTGRVDSIVGNVSGGLTTFFASTGTIFSILIVVVIILAISIIIWAVGRFGQRSEGQAVNL